MTINLIQKLINVVLLNVGRLCRLLILALIKEMLSQLYALLFLKHVILISLNNLFDKHAFGHCRRVVSVSLGLSQESLFFHFGKFIVFFILEYFVETFRVFRFWVQGLSLDFEHLSI